MQNHYKRKKPANPRFAGFTTFLKRLKTFVSVTFLVGRAGFEPEALNPLIYCVLFNLSLMKKMFCF
ncbi:hypothetical protein DCO46_04215 [Flavobacterium sp. HTF]|nr:hypothetical protein DCO46_04215 [Flavobacterium sp. HTF]